jgi:hypothetical protein
MTWFAIAAGVCLSSAVSHLALGLGRPRRRTHLTFAALMTIICPFQLVAANFHDASSLASAVTWARYGVALAIVIIAVFGVFIRQYTGARVPRAIAYPFLAISAVWLIYDLAAPRGLLFESQTNILVIGSAARAEGFTRVPLGSAQLAWHAFNSATVLWAVVAGWRMLRRGRPSQGMTVAIGATAFLVTVLVDTIRDASGRDWPYLGGFGVMVMATLLSAQLALDFRKSELRLATLVRESVRIRDELNTPLQTLQFGLDLVAKHGTIEHDHVLRLGRALDKLRRLGQSLRG